MTAGYPFKSTTPLVYQIKLEVAGHSFTTSPVQPIDSFGRNVIPPGTANANPRPLPQSTIYGFNGTFPGPRINAEYGTPALVRFENHLDVSNGFDRQDFGAPNHSFLTHLHNGHTAPESDGQPHYSFHRFGPFGRFEHEAAFEPGEWVDQLYLGYPAGGNDREKQSFFWFHDHVHGHTGANVYKGMVGLMPIYDPKKDRGDETDLNGLRLPGLRTDHPDGTFDVAYDIPMAFYDCRLDDGVTPHQDAHNGAGETHPEWWGKTFFRHFPNHGFVGDVFTINGTAYPVLEVKQRKYRLRFLDASVSRIYDFKLMRSSGGPKSAKSLGYTGDELQGQYRLPDGQQCMKLVQIANEGGLLPEPIVRNHFELWPAKRREFIVDFTRYSDGTLTKPGDEIYLVNTMKMTTGRLWDSADPAYKVPVMKIVIGGPPPEPDRSLIPTKLRAVPDLVPGALAAVTDQRIPHVRAPAGQQHPRPRDRVVHQRAVVRSRQADDLPEAGLGGGMADQQRRWRLGPPHAPAHGGAPDGGPQRRARARRQASGRQRQGGRGRAGPGRGRRDLPPLPDLRRPVRGALPQPRPRGPQHDVRLGHHPVEGRRCSRPRRRWAAARRGCARRPSPA